LKTFCSSPRDWIDRFCFRIERATLNNIERALSDWFSINSVSSENTTCYLSNSIGFCAIQNLSIIFRENARKLSGV
jgi:hypothetical protein